VEIESDQTNFTRSKGEEKEKNFLTPF